MKKNWLTFLVLIAAGGIFMLFAGGNTDSGKIRPSGGFIAAEDAKKLLENDKNVVLLDVRTVEEFADGHISGAILLPYDEINGQTAPATIPERTSTVVVYCRTGRRSAVAVETLNSLGYIKVYDLGGLTNWPYEIVR